MHVTYSGDIYIAETKSNVIRFVNGTTGIITTIAGSGRSGDAGEGGPALKADCLNLPFGVWVLDDRSVLIADAGNNKIKKLTPVCYPGSGLILDTATFTCVCPSGYTLNAANDGCDATCFGVANTSSTVCGGHGSCVDVDNCVCFDGWEGGASDCSVHSCEAMNNCSSHGDCVANNTCTCIGGWQGSADCSVASCDGLNNCNGNGICGSNNTCSCASGWSTNDCSVFNCDAINNCSGHGTCVNNNTCSCDSGWKGDSNCTTYSCEVLNNCNGHGSCTGANVCTCQSGWKGDSACSTYSCENVNNCNGHGSCSGANMFLSIWLERFC